MEDFSGSAMIALLPMTSDWCKIECPHLTLVYAGEIKDLDTASFNELAKDASMLAMMSSPVMLKVMSVEPFGYAEEQKVDALKFRPTPELMAMRRAVERWNKSEFPFNPHATIGPLGSYGDNPRYVAFDRVMVGWGKEQLVFSMISPRQDYPAAAY